MAYIKISRLEVEFRKYLDPSPSFKNDFLHKILGKNNPKYTSLYAVKNLNLYFKDGDKVGIIGRNGAGKSTLLKAISGIYPPCKGQIEILGQVTPILDLGAGFDPLRTVQENIFLNGTILGFSIEKMKSLQKEIIEFSELEGYLGTPLKNLSSGMKSRLAFSIATTVNPEILILDEVFATGDKRFVHKAQKKMRSLVSTCKIVLFVSHNEALIREICNKAIVLDKGQLQMVGSPDEAIEFYEGNLLA